MEKQEHKTITRPRKKKLQKIEIFLKMNILEKEIMLALKIKIFQTQTEKKQNI